MASSFSWTSLFKSPTPRLLCLGDPTLAKLNQVKLVCETESCATKSIHFCGLVFILEPHFCSHPGQNLSSFPNPFWINFLLMTRSSSLNTTRRSHLQPNHPIPRPYHTGQTPFLCIFKINLPHLQVKNYQEILKKPQTLMNPPILSLSTSPYPMEWRVF